MEKEIDEVEFTMFGIDANKEKFHELGKFVLKMELKLENAVITTKGCENGMVFVKHVRVDAISYESNIPLVRRFLLGQKDVLTICNFREQKFVVSCVSTWGEHTKSDIEQHLDEVIEGLVRCIEEH